MKHLLLTAFLSAGILAAQSNPAAGTLEGHVYNSLTGAPLRKASVILTMSTASARLVADTDADGKFQFTGLPPGTYRLSASRGGFLDRPARRPIPLAANEHLTTAEIRLPPQSAISGRVFDEDGETVDRVRILVFKQRYLYGRKLWDNVNNSIGETNDAGEYRVPNLTPGHYLVEAYYTRRQVDNQYGTPPKAFYVPVYYPNALNQEQATPVDVAVGTEARGMDIHLVKLARPPSVRLRGTITGLPTDSPAQVSVSLIPAEGGNFGGNTLARAPDFAFDLSPAPGQYTIFANVYSGSPEAYGSTVVTLTGDLSGVAVAMNPAPEVTGRVSLAESDAKANLQGVRVDLMRISSPSTSNNVILQVRSDAAGRFVLPKQSPGHFAIVNVSSLPDGCFVREVKFGGKELSKDEFEITTSSNLEIILSNTAGKIGGTVLDGDGKPVPGSSVTLISADGKSRPAKESVDDDGSFHFTGVRPGKYRLFAWEEVDDDLWQDPEFRKSYEGRATEITIGPGETQNVQPRVIPADALQ